MKRMIYVLIPFLFQASNCLQAQPSFPAQLVASSNVYQTLEVGLNKTVSLVFPSPIVFVDRGSKDLLVQKAKDMANVLFIKAAIETMKESSLSVITDDGKLYNYVANYSTNPVHLVVYPTPGTDLLSDSAFSKVTFLGKEYSQNEMTKNCHHVEGSRKFLHGIKDKSFGAKAFVNAIFVRDEIIYYQLVLTNHTNIDYDVDNTRFYIKDKKKGKRTAIQEKEVVPVFIKGDLHHIGGLEKNVVVLAFHQFTIPDDKHFFITITEKNGGRHLKLKIKNRKIVKARLF